MLQLGFRPKAAPGQKQGDAQGGPSSPAAVKAEVQPAAARAAASQPGTSTGGDEPAVDGFTSTCCCTCMIASLPDDDTMHEMGKGLGFLRSSISRAPDNSTGQFWWQTLALRIQEAKPARGMSAAAAALAAAKAAASATAHGQASVTETRRFAGKDVRVCAWGSCAQGWLAWWRGSIS